MINKNSRVKIFTHNDLDGIGAAILSKLFFNEVDYEILGVNEINDRVEVFTNDNEDYKYDYIFIVDLSVNEKVANLINEYTNYDGSRLILLDHHKTALNLNRFSWAKVVVENEDSIKESGTSLFYKYLCEKNKTFKKANIDLFVDMIRSYDTWDWSRDGVMLPKQLNDIFNIIGPEDFINEYLYILRNDCNYIIPEDHENLLKYKRVEIESYIEKKIKEVKIRENSWLDQLLSQRIIRRGTVLCDRKDCTSELGNRILEENPLLDYVELVYPGGIALRSEDFDVSVIAALNGGGGHRSAAGYKCSKWWKYLK